MIQDVDETLRRLLVAELAKLPGRAGPGAVAISFDHPAVAEASDDGTPRVNLFLHDVRENLTLRDESFAMVREPGKGIVHRKRAPIRLDLAYLVTAHAGPDAAEQHPEHRLLSDVLGVFFRFPAVPLEYLVESLKDMAESLKDKKDKAEMVEGRSANALHPVNVLHLTVAQADHPAHANPPLLWQALGGKMRPASGLVVTAPFDPFETKWTRVVREAILGVGQGTPPHGPRRPLDMSSVRVSAAGLITNQDGSKPLSGVLVSVEDNEKTAMTDERGFFYILDLPPGPHRLVLRKDGYHTQDLSTVAPSPGRPEQLEPMVIALQAASDEEQTAAAVVVAEAAWNAPELVEAERCYRVSLSGTLRYADGRPAAYIPVRVGRRRTITDGHGVYCFFDLPPGRHTVVAEVPGRGDLELAAHDGSAHGTIALAVPAPPDADAAVATVVATPTVHRAKGGEAKKSSKPSP